MKNTITFLACLILSFSYAQNFSQLGQNVGGQYTEGAFGWATAINEDGNIIAVSGPASSVIDSGTGLVVAYIFDGTNWNQLGQEITGEYGETAGTQIDMNSAGDRIVIGFPGAVPGGSIPLTNDPGVTRVYEYNGANWIQLGQDITMGNLSDNLGNSVSMDQSGNVVALSVSGTPSSTGSANPQQVMAYEWDGTSWNQKGNSIIEGVGVFGGGNMTHGCELSGDGNRIAVSMRWPIGINIPQGIWCCAGGDQGAVNVYEYDGVNWVQLGNEIYVDEPDPNTTDNDSFGLSYGRTGEAMSFNEDGTILAIGAGQLGGSGNGTDGYVNVYQIDSQSNWAVLGNTILPSYTASSFTSSLTSYFGASVSINNNGSRLVVGQPYVDNGNGTLAGRANLYEFLNGSWVESSNTVIGNGYTATGWSVSISGNGNNFIVGSRLDNGWAGNARVYAIESYNCTIQGCVDPGDGSGIYGSLVDCEAMCSCDVYDTWPVSDMNGGPNQGSWCEWCVDYENNNFQNFNTTGATWANPDVICDCCSVEPTESYNCTVEGCVDPGDGSGMYGSMADCEAMCKCDVYEAWPSSDINGGPNQGSWCEWCIDYENNNFQNFNTTGATWANPDVICDCCSTEPVENYNCTIDGCVDPGDGSGMYGSIADCEAMCSCDVYETWPVSDVNGGPNQGSWCEWCIDYENNNFQNFNPNGATWANPDVICDCCSVEPLESYNCTVDGCVDPGDGSGMYGSMSDCEAMCSCDVYDTWPVSDMNGGPNQGSWCEWCIDYENNNFQNFNTTGATWANPDVICDCCSVEPLESYNCTADGCVDPGDGSGVYGSMSDCEAMCSCDVYDTWPASDINGGPNQGSWCEWCIDYENNNFQNFNPNGATWANPDVICDCCDATGINELFGDGILIFPNPSNGKIYIELKNHYFERLEITNPLGQIIYSSLIDNDYYEESVDLSKYGNGIYLINVQGDDRNQVFKLLISQ